MSLILLLIVPFILLMAIGGYVAILMATIVIGLNMMIFSSMPWWAWLLVLGYGTYRYVQDQRKPKNNP